MPKQKFKVDFMFLTLAIESDRDVAEFYFDTIAGETIMLSDCCDDEAAQRQRIAADPERFLEVPQIGSREAFRFMEDFLETVKDRVAKNSLERALLGRKPFRAFKDELSDYPEVRKQWFDYHQKRMIEYARKWLEENEIEAE